MARKTKDPGQQIADAVRAGEIDASQALQAVGDVLSGALPTEEEPLTEEELQAQEEQAARDEEARRNRVNAIGLRLRNLAEQQVTLRQTTEERWYQDVRQFNGQYDPGTFPKDEAGEVPYGCQLYVPLTRRLVGLVEARLYDIIFQAGERNFVLKPTPVPDLDEAGSLADKLKPEDQVTMPDGQVIPVSDVAAAIRELTEEAGKRADAMQREIDDQLAECKYPTHARNCIHDAVLLGTGILKGPTILFKTIKRWTYDPASNSYTLKMERKPVPVTLRVDPWNFFPDMSATTIEEAEFVFERHYMTKKEVAALQDMEAVDKDALRRILGAEPTGNNSSHRERLRAINGASGAPDKRYEVWEYHGPITDEDLRDCGCEVEGDDPLVQRTGIVWFCEGVVLKAALNPLDSGELPYRVFTWQKDESNIFGFGLPYEVRDQQEAANSSFRAAQDNLGLIARPQVFADDTKVEPQNGRWDLEPGKFWRNKQGMNAKEALQFIDIPSRLQELMASFNLNKQLIEEVGTLPAWLAGQDAPAAMQSATQASISWTAANLWVRRCVRNWDDDIITPMITGYFDWNMQWSKKEEIKGDSRVQALGIAALVELEGQAQRMQAFIQAAKQSGVPPSSVMLMLRQYARAFKLDPDLVLPTEAELNKMREAEAKNPPQDIEQRKLDVAQENNQLDAKTAAENATLKREEFNLRREEMARRERALLIEVASRENTSMEEAARKYDVDLKRIAADLQDRREQRAHEAQTTNAELQSRYQTGAGV
jgi:8-oxo-dGTP pyrophosphatase MutT (NUDIX family)